ncbi:MAG: reverse transcriptase domain-containing protein [Candidatus Pacearchaeota archaeon]
MKTYKNLYSEIYNKKDLILAWRKARKGKTKKDYVIKFEKNFRENILKLHEELKNKTYFPKPLKTFILRDPKTRKISKSIFRDRIVHHSIINIIEPIFEKIFIHDSCANRIGKGTLFALKRLDLFKRKVSFNGTKKVYCLKADIKHYFQEVNHEVLISILQRKIEDEKLMNLIRKILINRKVEEGVGMPLGNLTSQFFANVYLNELDYFIKPKLKAKYYIRYVDDFVILHKSKEQLEIWKKEIDEFLKEKLKIELHPDKSRIIGLSRGIDFVGFRNFYYFRLLRKRNIKNFINKIDEFKRNEISKEKLIESFQGWNAYAKWANSFKLRRDIIKTAKLIYNPDL